MKHYCLIERINETDNATADLIPEAKDGVGQSVSLKA